ncbi:MAG: AMP-binding protein [Ferrimicrobium sp.]
MQELIAIELGRTRALVDAIATVMNRGDAVTIIDINSPPQRRLERLTISQPHRILDESGEHPYMPDAPLLEPGDRVVIATSGTTGRPKAVVHTETTLRASADAIAAYLGTGSLDHWLCALSPVYIGGLAIITRALLSDLPITIIPSFDPALVADAVKNGATRTAAVRAVLGRVDLSPFRSVLLGSQPPPEVIPPNAIVTYGLTETGSGVVYDGLPLPGVEIQIVEDVIWLKGPMIATRTRDNQELLTKNGWLITGDLGVIDNNDGRLRVLGRQGDLINTGGNKVYPHLVEEAVRTRCSGWFGDLCVFATPDPTWGQIVTLAIVPQGNVPDLPTIQSALTSVVESYELPRRLVVVREIPRTETGKPKRKLLIDPTTESN